MIDTGTREGRRAAERLRDELIIWLTTVRSDGQPQASPVWFLWDGEEFLVYSAAGTPRTRNLEANRRVALNLNSNDRGGDIVSFEAEARIDLGVPPCSRGTSAGCAELAEARRELRHPWDVAGGGATYPRIRGQ